jgi:hypothetical protein
MIASHGPPADGAGRMKPAPLQSTHRRLTLTAAGKNLPQSPSPHSGQRILRRHLQGSRPRQPLGCRNWRRDTRSSTRYAWRRLNRIPGTQQRLRRFSPHECHRDPRRHSIRTSLAKGWGVGVVVQAHPRSAALREGHRRTGPGDGCRAPRDRLRPLAFPVIPGRIQAPQSTSGSPPAALRAGC